MLKCWMLKSVCGGVGTVETIDRQHSNLESIPDQVYRYSKTLEELHLDANQISVLPKDLFKLTKLRYLTLSDNEIKKLPGSIGALVSLIEFDISRNDLEEVPEAIKFCKNLQIADFSNNAIGKLPEGFTQLAHLTQLSINDISISDLPHDIKNLVSLKRLEMRDNFLRLLPDSIGDLRLLEFLDVGGNELELLPLDIGNLQNLKELYLDNNEIQMLPSTLGRLKLLECLDVSVNRLKDLPIEICQLSSLEDLCVTDNKLRSLPKTIGHLTNLLSLKADVNFLVDIPESLGHCFLIQQLYLAVNLIHCIPRSIGLLNNLCTLHVDKNRLSHLPDEICDCSRLSILSVRRNHIRVIPENIGHLQQLKVLDLTGNQVAYLPQSLTSIANLRAVWLSTNQGSQCLPKFQLERIALDAQGDIVDACSCSGVGGTGTGPVGSEDCSEDEHHHVSHCDSTLLSEKPHSLKQVLTSFHLPQNPAEAETPPGLAYGLDNNRLMRLEEERDVENERQLQQRQRSTTSKSRTEKVMFSISNEVTNASPPATVTKVLPHPNSNSSSAPDNQLQSGLRRHGTPHPRDLKNRHQDFLNRHSKQEEDLPHLDHQGDNSSNSPIVPLKETKLLEEASEKVRDRKAPPPRRINPPTFAPSLIAQHSNSNSRPGNSVITTKTNNNNNSVFASDFKVSPMYNPVGSLTKGFASNGGPGVPKTKGVDGRDTIGVNSVPLASSDEELRLGQAEYSECGDVVPVNNNRVASNEEISPHYESITTPCDPLPTNYAPLSLSHPPMSTNSSSRPPKKEAQAMASILDELCREADHQAPVNPSNGASNAKPAKTGVSFAPVLPEIEVAVETLEVSLHRLHPNDSFGFSLAPMDPPGGIFVTKLATDNPDAPAVHLLQKNDRILKVNDLVISDGVLQHQQVVDILKASMDVTLTIERHVTRVTNQPESPTNFPHTNFNSSSQGSHNSNSSVAPSSTEIKPIPVLKKPSSIPNAPSVPLDKVTACGDVAPYTCTTDDDDDESQSHYESMDPPPKIPEIEEISVSRNQTGGNWPFTLAAGTPFWAAWDVDIASKNEFPTIFISSLPKNSSPYTGLMVGDRVLAVEGRDLSRPGVTLQNALDILVAHASVNTIKLLVKHPPPPPKGIMELVLDPGNEKIGINIRGGVDSRAVSNPWNTIDTAVYISGVLPMHKAALDGRLKPGQRILSVNGVQMINKTHEEAVKALISRDPYGLLKITVCDGYNANAPELTDPVFTQTGPGDDSNFSSSSEDENADLESMDDSDLDLPNNPNSKPQTLYGKS